MSQPTERPSRYRELADRYPDVMRALDGLGAAPARRPG
jgi:hypothetical protein